MAALDLGSAVFDSVTEWSLFHGRILLS
jgi:hypothetical protein